MSALYAGRWRDCCNSGEFESHEPHCWEGGYLCPHDLDLRTNPRCYLCKPLEDDPSEPCDIPTEDNA